jgi:hypothetical protein
MNMLGFEIRIMKKKISLDVAIKKKLSLIVLSGYIVGRVTANIQFFYGWPN